MASQPEEVEEGVPPQREEGEEVPPQREEREEGEEGVALPVGVAPQVPWSQSV